MPRTSRLAPSLNLHDDRWESGSLGGGTRQGGLCWGQEPRVPLLATQRVRKARAALREREPEPWVPSLAVWPWEPPHLPSWGLSPSSGVRGGSSRSALGSAPVFREGRGGEEVPGETLWAVVPQLGAEGREDLSQGGGRRPRLGGEWGAMQGLVREGLGCRGMSTPRGEPDPLGQARWIPAPPCLHQSKVVTLG